MKAAIERANIKLTCNVKKQSFKIETNGETWRSEGRGRYLTFYSAMGKKLMPILKSFASARKISYAVNKCDDYTELAMTFDGFRALVKKLDIAYKLSVRIYDGGKVTFTIGALRENAGKYLRSINWPGTFNMVGARKDDSYTVGAYRQGFMLCDRNDNKFKTKLTMTTFVRDVNTGDCYMPLWGRVSGVKGYCGYMADGNDAGVFSSYGKGMCILSSPYWFSSLGKLGYDRETIFKFYNKCDYNDFAKEYRAYLIDKGEFVTIKDKLAANPNVAKLIGTPVIHTNIFTTTQPESQMYTPETAHKLFATFQERADAFSKFKELGLDKAYIHLDGWGKLGYDNLHPYILPPCPEAGGSDGMRALSKRAKDIGYIFGLHDNYRDFYTRSAVYDSELAVKRIDGTSFLCKVWNGGAHNWLCTSQAPQFVKRTYKELKELGIEVQGAYLDVFSIVLGDQCFHPDHILTRRESIAYRKECFDYLRSKGLIVCSEEPGALMVNAIDMVHHAPYKLEPQEGGETLGIAIPLFNLVYHDCIFVPWCVDGRGGWGVPTKEKGELHCIFNAQTPYFNGFNGTHMANEPGMLEDKDILERIERVKRVSEVQAKLYDKELVKHEFISKDRRVQRNTYSDGTTITVDFAKELYDINYGA